MGQDKMKQIVGYLGQKALVSNVGELHYTSITRLLIT